MELFLDAKPKFDTDRKKRPNSAVVVDHATIETALSHFTISVWIFAQNYPCIVYFGRSFTLLIDTNCHLSVRREKGSLYQLVSDDQYQKSYDVINEWTHLAVSRSNGFETFYVNGKLTRPIDMTSLASKKQIPYFKGRIDDLYVYNKRALSHAEIVQLMSVYF